MTASILKFFPEMQKKWEAQESKERELAEALRTNCLDALNDISDAMRHPRISLPYIDGALAKLTVARDCAKALDGPAYCACARELVSEAEQRNGVCRDCL